MEMVPFKVIAQLSNSNYKHISLEGKDFTRNRWWWFKEKKNHYLPSHTLYFLIKSRLFKQEEEVWLPTFCGTCLSFSTLRKNRKNHILAASWCLHKQGDVRSSSPVKDQKFVLFFQWGWICVKVPFFTLAALHLKKMAAWAFELGKGRLGDGNLTKNTHITSKARPKHWAQSYSNFSLSYERTES